MVPGVMVKRGWINETQRTFQDLKLFSMRSKSEQIDVTILLFNPTECTASRMINVQTAFWVIITEQSKSLYQMQHSNPDYNWQGEGTKVGTKQDRNLSSP